MPIMWVASSDDGTTPARQDSRWTQCMLRDLYQYERPHRLGISRVSQVPLTTLLALSLIRLVRVVLPWTPQATLRSVPSSASIMIRLGQPTIISIVRAQFCRCVRVSMTLTLFGVLLILTQRSLRATALRHSLTNGTSIRFGKQWMVTTLY